jgi:DNA-binding MarR family transcriptional regulator
MEADITISEGQYLFSLLGATFNAIMNARKKEIEPSGISLTRHTVLWVLKAMGRPTTIAEIAQILGRDHLTTSQLLKRMESERLIEREKGTRRRNPITLMLSTEGNEALNRTLERNEVIDEIMSCLSRDEQKNLIKYLRKLREKAVTKGALYSPFPGPVAATLKIQGD